MGSEPISTVTKRQAILCFVVLILLGAAIHNVAWLWYSDRSDARRDVTLAEIRRSHVADLNEQRQKHAEEIARLERSHKYQMGLQRKMIGEKIDSVLVALPELVTKDQLEEELQKVRTPND